MFHFNMRRKKNPLIFFHVFKSEFFFLIFFSLFLEAELLDSVVTLKFYSVNLYQSTTHINDFSHQPNVAALHLSIATIITALQPHINKNSTSTIICNVLRKRLCWSWCLYLSGAITETDIKNILQRVRWGLNSINFIKKTFLYSVLDLCIKQ